MPRLPQPRPGRTRSGAGLSGGSVSRKGEVAKIAVNRSFGRLWPHCDAKRSLVTVRAPVSGARFPVHAGIAPLVAEGLRRMERGVGGPAYLCKPAQCGAFNCRPIGGTRSPSNHSGALAMDINWNDNPFRKGARYAMPEWVWRMWESLGFYWGGRYSDFMHIEYLKTPAAAAAAVRGLTGGAGPTSGGTTLRPGDTGDAVRKAQRAMAIKVDGHYGSATEAAVRDIQRANGLTVDGICGPATWAALDREDVMNLAQERKMDRIGVRLEETATAILRLAEAQKELAEKMDERVVALLEQILAKAG